VGSIQRTIIDLVNMVMDVLASNDRCNGVGLLLLDATRALKLSSFLLKTGLHRFWVTVLEVTLLGTHHLVRVLLWQDFAILHRLNGGVVVVLVNLTIDNSLSLFMTLLDDVLVDHGRGNFLMNSGIMMTSFGPVV
jgi:hypothetical protein